MNDEGSPLDMLLISFVLADEAKKAQAAGGDIIEALKARIPQLEKLVSALRPLATHLEATTSPAAVQKRASDARAARDRHAAQRRAWEDRVTQNVKIDNAGIAVQKCKAGKATAERELASLRKVEAPDRDIVLAEGAVSLWGDRLERAERAMQALLRRAEARRD